MVRTETSLVYGIAGFDGDKREVLGLRIYVIPHSSVLPVALLQGDTDTKLRMANAQVC
jgi:hypothetical protein